MYIDKTFNNEAKKDSPWINLFCSVLELSQIQL